MLDALAKAENIAEADQGIGANVSIEREVTTDAGHRIDLLIESDTHAILIENKIFASANNPFVDYSTYLDRRAPAGSIKHKVLLTLFPSDEGNRWDFQNLTYVEFVGQIRSMLGHHLS